MQLKSIIESVKSAVLRPTGKQKEAYGRFLHTIAAAGFIGAATITFTETQVTLYAAARVASLAIWSVLLLIVGAVLSKGD